jgi:hypothetical protein
MSIRVPEIGDRVTWVEDKDTAFTSTIKSIGIFSPGGNLVRLGDPNARMEFLLEGLSDWVPAHECIFAEDTEKAKEFFEQDDRSPHLIDLGYSLVQWMDGVEARPDNETLLPIIPLLLAIQYDKEGYYGSSWKGKGEYRGIMANIDRKYDRLDKMTQDEIDGIREPLFKIEQDKSVYGTAAGYESKIDAVADLTNYCLLYLAFMRVQYPKMFNSWVQNNVPDHLRAKIPFIQ